MRFEDAHSCALGFARTAENSIAASVLDRGDDCGWCSGAGYRDELGFQVGGDGLDACYIVRCEKTESGIGFFEPSSLCSEDETSLMQASQLSGTAKVVSKGGIMAGNSLQVCGNPGVHELSVRISWWSSCCSELCETNDVEVVAAEKFAAAFPMLGINQLFATSPPCKISKPVRAYPKCLNSLARYVVSTSSSNAIEADSHL